MDVLGSKPAVGSGLVKTFPNGGVLGSLTAGLGAAAERPGIVAMLWSCHLVLGFAIAIPMFRWLYDATAFRPAADVLASRFSFGWLAELLQLDNSSMIRILQSGAAGGALIAILASPFLISATLASLRDASLRRASLAAAATTLYWPFLRVIVFGRAFALAAGGLIAVVLRFALTPLSDATWEGGFFLAGAIQVTAAVLVTVFLLAGVDYALVCLEAGRSRTGLRAWLAGLRFAVERPALAVGVWVGAGVMLALAIGVFAAVREITLPGATALPEAVAFAFALVVQQAFMLGRTWLRVGLLGAEQHAFEHAREPSLAIGCEEGVTTMRDAAAEAPPDAMPERAVRQADP
jgi:hypothetical protein